MWLTQVHQAVFHGIWVFEPGVSQILAQYLDGCTKFLIHFLVTSYSILIKIELTYSPLFNHGNDLRTHHQRHHPGWVRRRRLTSRKSCTLSLHSFMILTVDLQNVAWKKIRVVQCSVVLTMQINCHKRFAGKVIGRFIFPLWYLHSCLHKPAICLCPPHSPPTKETKDEVDPVVRTKIKFHFLLLSICLHLVLGLGL